MTDTIPYAIVLQGLADVQLDIVFEDDSRACGYRYFHAIYRLGEDDGLIIVNSAS